MNESTKNGRTTLNGIHHPVLDFCRRDIGGLSSRNFSTRFSGSKNLVMRLEMYKKLERNEACVTTMSFNGEGDVLVSVSEDGRLTLWDWERGNMKLSFPSAHSGIIFQAKFMPFSNGRTIVTCGTDKKVRHVSIREGGKVETSVLGMNQHFVTKIAIEPGSPHIFYTCGDDGLVQHFDLRTEAPTNFFTCQPARGSWDFGGSRLHAIAINPRNSNLLAVGGNIDEFARLYDIRKFQCDGSSSFSRAADHFCPPHLIGNKQGGVTGLAFSEQNELLVSYSAEFIYLFAHDMGLGHTPIPVVSKSKPASPKDQSRCSVPLVYKGHENFYSVIDMKFFGPRSEYVVSGSECGHIFIWRRKCGELIRVMGEDIVMGEDRHVVTDIEPHPHIPVLATIRLLNDVKIWTPEATQRATLPKNMRQVQLSRQNRRRSRFYG